MWLHSCGGRLPCGEEANAAPCGSMGLAKAGLVSEEGQKAGGWAVAVKEYTADPRAGKSTHRPLFLSYRRRGKREAVTERKYGLAQTAKA